MLIDMYWLNVLIVSLKIKRNESLLKDFSRIKVISNWIGLNMIIDDNL